MEKMVMEETIGKTTRFLSRVLLLAIYAL